MMKIEIGTTADYWCSILDERLDSRLDWLKAMGISHIGYEIPFTCTDIDRGLQRLPAAIDEAREKGLAVGSVFPQPWKWTNEATEDPTTVDRLEQVIDALGEVGVPRLLLGCSFRQVTAMSEQERDAHALEIYDNYRRISRRAEASGVKLCTHTSLHEGSLLATPEDLTKFLQEVSSPANGLLFCYVCESDFGRIDDDIRFWKDRIFAVHMRNVRRTPEGTRQMHMSEGGDVEVPSVLQTLSDIGFDGPLIPEHYPLLPGDAGSETATASAVGYLQAELDQLDRSN